MLLDVMDEYIAAVVDLRKPVMVAANGPGVGAGCTMLGVVDYAVCAEHAYFWAPFSRLAIVAEFCSSLTFPEIIGRSRASQLFMFNHKMTSKEALEWGLVSRVFPTKQFEASVQALLHDRKAGLLAGNSLAAMQATKELIVNDERRALLHKVRVAENKLLLQRLISPEAVAVAEAFLARARKSR